MASVWFLEVFGGDSCRCNPIVSFRAASDFFFLRCIIRHYLQIELLVGYWVCTFFFELCQIQTIVRN